MVGSKGLTLYFTGSPLVVLLNFSEDLCMHTWYKTIAICFGDSWRSSLPHVWKVLRPPILIRILRRFRIRGGPGTRMLCRDAVTSANQPFLPSITSLSIAHRNHHLLRIFLEISRDIVRIASCVLCRKGLRDKNIFIVFVNSSFFLSLKKGYKSRRGELMPYTPLFFRGTCSPTPETNS